MSNSYSNILLKSLGFDTDFFCKINATFTAPCKSTIPKCISETAISKIPTDISLNCKICDEDQNDLYDECEDNYNNFESDDNIFTNYVEKEPEVEVQDENQSDLKLFQNCSDDQLNNLKTIFNKMTEDKENKIIVKAYKSKLKTKFYEIYQQNSELIKEKVKYKIFHKCNFPSCKRTFSSSGWLRSHFNEHMKDVKKNKFNIMFDDYIERFRKESFV